MRSEQPRKLPLALERHESRKVNRLLGQPTGTALVKSVRKGVQVRKVVVPQVSNPMAPPPSPLVSRSRLQNVDAVKQERDRTLVRAQAAGPTVAGKVVKRMMRSIDNAGKAARVKEWRQNPPHPQADRVSGMLKFTRAFVETKFRAPFQANRNLGKSYGA